MPKKKSFILHKDSLIILNEMTDEQAGKFLKIIYQYQISETLPKLDFAMKMAIMPFINQFKRDNESYKKICKSNKDNGSKGGKKKVANASDRYRLQTNLADSDSDSDRRRSNNKSIKEIKIEKKETQKAVCVNFKIPTLEEVKKYCLERKNNINPEEFIDSYEANGWQVGKNDMKNWKATIRGWEKKEWKYKKSKPKSEPAPLPSIKKLSEKSSKYMPELSSQKFWKVFIKEIKQFFDKIDTNIYLRWLSKMKPFFKDNKEFVISLPSKFLRDWIKREYANNIEKIYQKVTKTQNFCLIIIYDENNKE